MNPINPGSMYPPVAQPSSAPPYHQQTPFTNSYSNSGPSRDIGFVPPPPSAYPNQPGVYPSQQIPAPYPNQSSYPSAVPQPQNTSYAMQPGIYPTQTGAYPRSPQPSRPYPTQSGVYYPSSPQPHQGRHNGGILNNLAATATAGGIAATAGGLLLSAKHGKFGKKVPKKAMKKAMKLGIPLAAAGVGAYAIKKSFHHHGSSSSSSSSSSSDSD